MCGEKGFSASSASRTSKSPPRVRGKGKEEGESAREKRITPACAGKRTKTFCCRRRCWDHPRVCGEKWMASRRAQTRRGSPPRVRGKGAPGKDGAGMDRITPACAGKSRLERSPVRAIWDHPRVCGEKCGSRSAATRLLGSPPRVRGKVIQHCHLLDNIGITPACAGKRFTLPKPTDEFEDHPRVCGEKKVNRYVKRSRKGSPPRVRGKADSWEEWAVAHLDHPRGCGEK